MSNTPIGISGIAVHVPPFRISLQDWCKWTDADWNKISNVVGTGFRLPGAQQSVYTMAATAILRLIERYDINPAEVGFLALGTESSTDNSAGAVIAKGMVDDALAIQGKPTLSRNCEVPEFKHACLGGIYALKNAVRYLNTDGANSKAIVVCSDIALYGLGTSGEPTQGAGAVAILLETNPTIASIDLCAAGSASDYRGVDFRKPIQYHNGTGLPVASSNIPVFNGRYSASCYVDEMRHALDAMYARSNISAADYLHKFAAIFMHRPFKRMPENGLGMAWLFSLAANAEAGHATLRTLCAKADISFDALLQEIQNPPVITDFAASERIHEEAFPQMNKLLRSTRGGAEWQQHVATKISLGSERMEELGNLYTGALPAWFAAGLEEAADNDIDLTDKELLLIGYGSGDAAEAIPVKVVAGWQTAVAKIDMASAMAAAIDLSKDEYLALREGRGEACPDFIPKDEFVVDRIGSDNDENFQDKGIEYYRYNN
jgi:hydroxymethylglutaryl-CoA synthase